MVRMLMWQRSTSLGALELEAQQRGCILEEEHFILPKDAETVQRASK